VLEIVEGEAFGRHGCASAYGFLTMLCMCEVLVSMGSSAGITAGVVTPSMPAGGPRCEWRFVLWNCVIKMLAEVFQTARLETRTKESNMYASWWVENP
jgi:hypothetical protein